MNKKIKICAKIFTVIIIINVLLGLNTTSYADKFSSLRENDKVSISFNDLESNSNLYCIHRGGTINGSKSYTVVKARNYKYK